MQGIIALFTLLMASFLLQLLYYDKVIITSLVTLA